MGSYSLFGKVVDSECLNTLIVVEMSVSLFNIQS